MIILYVIISLALILLDCKVGRSSEVSIAVILDNLEKYIKTEAGFSSLDDFKFIDIREGIRVPDR